MPFESQGRNRVGRFGRLPEATLRFAEHPHCTLAVVQRIGVPSSGAGEAVMGAAGAAIANAFFDAAGVRLRQYPPTPKRAALAAGKTGGVDELRRRI